MRQAMLTLALLVATAIPATAQQTSQAVTHESATIGTVATGLAQATLRPSGGSVDSCTFTVETNDLRVRVDGGAPTSSVGHLVKAGQSFTVAGAPNLAQLRFIRAGAADATLQASCSLGTQSTPLEIGAAGSSATIEGGVTVDSVTVSSSALPTGASTAANQTTILSRIGEVQTTPTANTLLDRLKSINDLFATNYFGTAGSSASKVLSVQGIASGTALPVSGTFWQATQPVSLASVPSHAVTNAGAFAVQAAQSGTWTVQPGNTANTTPWLVDASGNVASGAADSGNPVKIGGVYNSSPPTFSNGQRVNSQFDVNGNLKVNIAAGSSAGPTETEDGSIAEGQNGSRNISLNYVKSGSVWVPASPADATHGGTLFATGPQILAAGHSSAPTAVTNGTPVRPWADLVGRLQFNVSQINGVAPSMGTGASDTGTQRVAIATDQAPLAGLGVGATAAAVPANANYIAGRAGANLEPVAACGQQQLLRMTTATTTELVAAPGSGRVRLCSVRVFAEGTTSVTFVRGTGANCGTGQATVDGPYGLVAQTGWQAGTGIGTIMDAGADTSAICVTSSAAVGLTIFVRYTTY